MNEETHTKPPMGLRPRFIVDEHREEEIVQAIDRYTQAQKEIPKEWMEELDELRERMRKRSQ